VLWTAPVAAIVRSSPAVAHGLVYGGSLSVFDALGLAGCSGVRGATGVSVRSSPGSPTESTTWARWTAGSTPSARQDRHPARARSLTGDVVGPVTVGATESVCVTNARVTGPVAVNPGGALTVIEPRITNGLVPTSPSYFSLCGFQLGAPLGNATQGVVVTGGRSSARVGDPEAGCAGNRVTGDVSRTGATAGLTVGANAVSSNVRVDNNPSLAVIKANTIFATLACSGNSPPPTNAGQPNTAAAKTGQCAAR
jgi:hypothetical protein